MSVAVPDSIRELRQRVQRMEGTALSRPLPVVDALAPVVSLRTGSACSVDSLSLALALLAGPSAAGEWTAVVGLPDLGWEAAREYGVDLSRTVSVPDPGEHWLNVTAALIDVTTVVAVRPPGAVTEHQAARIAARLRQRDAALIVCGTWPRAAARLSVSSSVWHGLGQGHGHLNRCEVIVHAVIGSTPPQRLDLWLPGPDLEIALAAPAGPVLTAVKAG